MKVGEAVLRDKLSTRGSSTVEKERENVGKGRWSRGLMRVELKSFSVCQTRVHFVCRVQQKHDGWLQDNERVKKRVLTCSRI